MKDTEKIDNIRQEIFNEAKSKRDELLNAATKWAENYEKEKTDAINKKIDEIIQQTKKNAEQQARQLVLSAQVEQKNIRLKKEADLIEEIFIESVDKLELIRKDSNYPEMIKSMITEAILKLTEDDLFIIIDERDENIITRDFLSSIEIIFVFTYNRPIRLDIAEEKIKTSGGIIIKVKDKNLYINNTFEERLNILKNQIKTDIIKELAV